MAPKAKGKVLSKGKLQKPVLPRASTGPASSSAASASPPLATSKRAAANEVLEKYLRQAPANRELRLTLAQFYQQQGKPEAARQLLLALGQINPDDPVLRPPAQ